MRLVMPRSSPLAPTLIFLALSACNGGQSVGLAPPNGLPAFESTARTHANARVGDRSPVLRDFAVPRSQLIVAMAPATNGIWFVSQINGGQSAGLGRITPRGKVKEFRYPGSIGRVTTMAGCGRDKMKSSPCNAKRFVPLWFPVISGSSLQLGRIGKNGHVTVVTPSGAPSGSLGFYSVAATSPSQVWLGIFASSGGYLAKLNPSTGALTSYPVPYEGSNAYIPIGIARGPDGNIWFASEAKYVGKSTSSGSITMYPLSSANIALGGIAAGPDGNMWVTEENAGSVARVTPSGGVKTIATPNCSAPTAIAAGADGNLWVDCGVTLLRMTPKGAMASFNLPDGNSTSYTLIRGQKRTLWFNEDNMQAGTSRIGRVSL